MGCPNQSVSRFCLIGLLGLFLSLSLGSSAWSATWEPRELLKKYLTAHYPWAEIEILDISGLETLPKGPPKKIYLISGPLGRAVFSFVFTSEERAIVQAQIRALDWVVTSRRPLSKGQVITKDDVYLDLIDVRRMPKDALTRLEAVYGKTVNRSLGANIPIIEIAMGDIPIIKKGQQITLIVSTPGLKITTLGEAREDGHPGRQIRVVNLSSGRDVRGTPIDDKNVKVFF